MGVCVGVCVCSRVRMCREEEGGWGGGGERRVREGKEASKEPRERGKGEALKEEQNQLTDSLPGRNNVRRLQRVERAVIKFLARWLLATSLEDGEAALSELGLRGTGLRASAISSPHLIATGPFCLSHCP